MTPLMRFFTLVGIALAAASMQMKSRAEPVTAAEARQVQAVVPASLEPVSQND